MERPLQITFRGLPHSDAIEARIREKAAELERFHDHITGCHVSIEAPHHRHHHGTIYSVHVDLRVPGGELVVSRERGQRHSHEDVYVAIRDAFGAAVRQLEDHVRRQRRQVKQHEEPARGRVIKLFPDDGYGFVEMPDGTDVYFHENSVRGGLAALAVGDEVRLSLSEGDKGPQASAIIPAGRRR